MAPSDLGSVNETSVRPVPLVDTFCTIMSRFASASASARNSAAAWPGLSGTPTTVTLASLRSCATPEMIACSMPRSSMFPATIVPGRFENDERTWIGTPYRRPYSTQRSISTLAPQAAISSISS